MRTFVCYTRTDRPFVEPFVARLRRAFPRDTIWFDEELRGGDIWWKGLLSQIDDCDLLIYLLSKESVTSPYCRAEFTEAKRLQKRILAIQVRDRTAMSPELAETPYVNMRTAVDDVKAAAEVERAINTQRGLLPGRKLDPVWPTRTACPEVPIEPAPTVPPAREDVDTPPLTMLSRSTPSEAAAQIPWLPIAGGILAVVVVAIFLIALVTSQPAGSVPTGTPPPATLTVVAAAPSSTPIPVAATLTAIPAGAAGAATVASNAAGASGAAIKIGLSFSDFATERWPVEAKLMTDLLVAKGYDVLVQEAAHDTDAQNDQIDGMVAQGVKGLLVVPEDADKVILAVERAAKAGVIVVSYDRLIKSTSIAAYVSFNNQEVGRQQALGVLTALGIKDGGNTGKWTKDNPVRLVKLGGNPTDNNAVLFRAGQDEMLKPYVDSGVIKIVADQWVPNWDAAQADKIMETILASLNNQLDAVVASNDATALGAMQALKAQKLAGLIPISGQDATADGCNSIVNGELTVTILKDIRNLTPLGVNLMDDLLHGKTVSDMKEYTLAELTLNDKYPGEIMADFLPVQQVNKDNVYDLVVKSGFQSYDDVYRNIPEGQRPPRPAAATPAS